MVPESFTPAPRLISDSTRSPKLRGDIQGDGQQNDRPHLRLFQSEQPVASLDQSQAQQERTDLQGVIEQENTHYQACRQDAAAPSQVFFGLMRGAIRCRPKRSADEVSEDVARPHHEKKIENPECARPLLTQLHQHSHGKRNVGEGESRCCRRRIGSAHLRAPHRDRQKNKWRNGAGESHTQNKLHRGKLRGLARSARGQQQKK